MNYKEYLLNRCNKKPQCQNRIAFFSWLTEIGTQIRTIRKESNISQIKLAEKMDVKQSTIARIESGHNMTCETLWKLSNSLFLDLSIFGVDKENKGNEINNYIHNENNISDAPIEKTALNNYDVSKRIPRALLSNEEEERLDNCSMVVDGNLKFLGGIYKIAVAIFIFNYVFENGTSYNGLRFLIEVMFISLIVCVLFIYFAQREGNKVRDLAKKRITKKYNLKTK